MIALISASIVVSSVFCASFTISSDVLNNCSMSERTTVCKDWRASGEATLSLSNSSIIKSRFVFAAFWFGNMPSYIAWSLAKTGRTPGAAPSMVGVKFALSSSLHESASEGH